MGRGVLAQHPGKLVDLRLLVDWMASAWKSGRQGGAIWRISTKPSLRCSTHDDTQNLASLQMLEMDCAHQNDKLDQPASSW